ncbi:MAG: hypothetical protein ICV67_00545 [Thermoleophilia bacterium]|nr:hypothetical protein [Thermoleophilia bacterium]
MGGRVLSVLAVAAVVAVAAAAAIDSLRADEHAVIAAPGAQAAREPLDCVDSRPCLRRLREQVAFYRGCVGSWNDPANSANQATVTAGGFDTATLFRTAGERCSLHLVSTASVRVLVARRVDGRWTAVGGGRRPPAADDFRDAFTVAIGPDGTLALRQNPGR